MLDTIPEVVHEPPPSLFGDDPLDDEDVFGHGGELDNTTASVQSDSCDATPATLASAATKAVSRRRQRTEGDDSVRDYAAEAVERLGNSLVRRDTDPRGRMASLRRRILAKNEPTASSHTDVPVTWETPPADHTVNALTALPTSDQPTAHDGAAVSRALRRKRQRGPHEFHRPVHDDHQAHDIPRDVRSRARFEQPDRARGCLRHRPPARLTVHPSAGLCRGEVGLSPSPRSDVLPPEPLHGARLDHRKRHASAVPLPDRGSDRRPAYEGGGATRPRADTQDSLSSEPVADSNSRHEHVDSAGTDANPERFDRRGSRGGIGGVHTSNLEQPSGSKRRPRSPATPTLPQTQCGRRRYPDTGGSGPTPRRQRTGVGLTSVRDGHVSQRNVATDLDAVMGRTIAHANVTDAAPATRAELIARLRNPPADADQRARYRPSSAIRQRTPGLAAGPLHDTEPRDACGRGYNAAREANSPPMYSAAASRLFAASDAIVARDVHDARATADGDVPAAAATVAHPVLLSAPASVGEFRTEFSEVASAEGPARRRIRGKQRVPSNSPGHPRAAASQRTRTAANPATSSQARAGRPPE